LKILPENKISLNLWFIENNTGCQFYRYGGNITRIMNLFTRLFEV
jgi:hypothetical protein